jgi:hypothetical protein
MNVCSFTGFVADDPVMRKVNGVNVINFTLVTYSYRRAKSTGETLYLGLTNLTSQV